MTKFFKTVDALVEFLAELGIHFGWWFALVSLMLANFHAAAAAFAMVAALNTRKIRQTKSPIINMYVAEVGDVVEIAKKRVQ